MLLRTNLRRDRTQTINRKSQLHRLDREVAKATPRRITAHTPETLDNSPPPRADIGQRRRDPHQPAPSLGRRVDDATDKRRTSRHSLPHANNHPQQNPAPRRGSPQTTPETESHKRTPSIASHNPSKKPLPPPRTAQLHKIGRDTTRPFLVSGGCPRHRLCVEVKPDCRYDICHRRRAPCLLSSGLLEPPIPASVVNLGGPLTTQQRRQPNNTVLLSGLTL